MNKRIVLLTGSEFGWHCLDKLLECRANVVGVLGPGTTRLTGISDYKSPADILSGTDVPFHQVDSVNSGASLDLLRGMAPDVLLVMGWQEILRRAALEIPKGGCIGSHPTELPKYRGGAPIPHTILRGLTYSALTFFYLDPKVDAGDILLQERFAISAHETATTLYAKVVAAGRTLTERMLPLVYSSSPPRIKQDPARVVEVWPKRRPEDGLIDWSRPASEVYTLVRAVTHPYPGAFTFLGDSKIVIWGAQLLSMEHHAAPGTILELSDRGPTVAAQDGALLLLSVQGSSYEMPGNVYFASRRYVNSRFHS